MWLGWSGWVVRVSVWFSVWVRVSVITYGLGLGLGLGHLRYG